MLGARCTWSPASARAEPHPISHPNGDGMAAGPTGMLTAAAAFKLKPHPGTFGAYSPSVWGLLPRLLVSLLRKLQVSGLQPGVNAS